MQFIDYQILDEFLEKPIRPSQLDAGLLPTTPSGKTIT
jgi:hypothetical protein